MRNIRLLIAGMLFASTSIAQIPDYIPANGLAAWWGFNGNANDASGNGNNGTVSGATLTTDRFGTANSAYQMDGINDHIMVLSSSSLQPAGQVSFMAWIRPEATTSFVHVLTKNYGHGHNSYVINYHTPSNLSYSIDINPGTDNTTTSPNPVQVGVWTHTLGTYDGTTLRLYENGVLVKSTLAPNVLSYSGNPLWIGASNNPLLPGVQYLKGKVDDVAVWNRALTDNEVKQIYSGCKTAVASQPYAVYAAKNTSAQLNVTANSVASYQWQSNPAGFGWMNVPENAAYSGTATGELTINNVQHSNHAQSFRLVIDSAGCRDTSDLIHLYLSDSCINTIIDTIHVTVTDTLIIQTVISGIGSPDHLNTVKLYPNPTSDMLTIDQGDHVKMSGYQLKLFNTLGQEVYTSLFSQQSVQLNLSSLGAKGIYTVQIIDPQNNVIDTRKIVLQ